jgi:aconitate hydratase
MPAEDPSSVKVIKGPNIKSIPLRGELPDAFEKEVLLKLDNNITTDDISPAGAMYLPMRSNVPLISNYVFFGIDPTFAERAREKDGGILVAGENYGQGSAREHAALCPMFLGIRAVMAKSFARIHHNNLINWGILPLWFENPADYDRILPEDVLRFDNARQAVLTGIMPVTLVRTGETLNTRLELTELQKEILLHGGRLLHEKANHNDSMTEEFGLTPIRLP